MKTIQVDVKSKGEVLATIDVPQYENEEDLATMDLSKILALVNRQLKADICNAKRAEFRESEPGKQKRYKLGMNCLPTVVFDDGETGIDKLKKVGEASDPIKALDALIASPEVQAAVDKLIG